MNFKKTITKTASLHIESCWKWVAKDSGGMVWKYQKRPQLRLNHFMNKDDPCYSFEQCQGLCEFFRDIPWKESLISVAQLRKKFEVK